MPGTASGDGQEPPDVYDLLAVEEAKVAGLYGLELEAILQGLAPTEMMPPLPGEKPSTYADRAVSQLLIRYIVRWSGVQGA